MNGILYFGLLATLFNFLTSCNGQTNQQVKEIKQIKSGKLVGGGCELMYVEMPKVLSSEHTSIGWEEGRKKLILIGKVLQLDGKIPASDVIVYY
jgi:protocatechuate 3,4-dioxygenase, beta subunit